MEKPTNGGKPGIPAYEALLTLVVVIFMGVLAKVVRKRRPIRSYMKIPRGT